MSISILGLGAPTAPLKYLLAYGNYAVKKTRSRRAFPPAKTMHLFFENFNYFEHCMEKLDNPKILSIFVKSLYFDAVILLVIAEICVLCVN